MPKKRKTRKEKIQQDHKKQTVHETPAAVASSPKNTAQESITPGMTFSLPETKAKPAAAPQKTKSVSQTITVSTSEYGYLSNDLMRTALLTGAIVLAELVIKLFIVR